MEPLWRWGIPGGLPDRGLCLQAVEELLESLDLEKSSCCLGLSRVSRPCGEVVTPHSPVTFVHVAGSPPLPSLLSPTSGVSWCPC